MEPLASVDDVETVWRPTSGSVDVGRIESLIRVASAKLRQACPFNIDARMLLFAHQPNDPIALDPVVVASVVATIVKRYLVNPDGVVTSTDTAGPYSRAQSFVNRYDKSGSDVRGAIQVIGSDIDELRPATPTRVPGSIQMVPTRAMEPAPGYWPNGYRPRVDPVTGDPAFGFPYDRPYGDDYNGTALNPSLRVPLTASQLSNAKGQTVTTIRSVTAATTAAAGEELLVTTGGSVITVTLPRPSNGALVVVKKADAGGGSVVVVPAIGGQSINNAGSLSIDTQYQSFDFVSDGDGWWAA